MKPCGVYTHSQGKGIRDTIGYVDNLVLLWEVDSKPVTRSTKHTNTTKFDSIWSWRMLSNALDMSRRTTTHTSFVLHILKNFISEIK